MILKEIEISGFKSFADKQILKFDGGITAIVGPNGCGKSNVADSIRWVLGEQSSKILRGNNMQDVIFKGTDKRKSLSYCEVSLIFDNSSRVFNIDYDEVVITRKLYRSGESEYLLNRNVCRLKDIVELLHDSGLGREGYSIIGQGKVDQILSNKPEDRRGIFEEAAGIAKFKSRKLEAERKLDRTRDNMTRIKDIVSEIERQVGPLKKQSEQAKLYLELASKLKQNEVNLYVASYDTAEIKKDKIRQNMLAFDEELALRQEDLDNISKLYSDSLDKLNSSDKNIQKINDQILSITIDIEKSAGESNLTKERLKFLQEKNKGLIDDLNKLKAELEQKQNKIESNKKRIANIGIELASLKKEEQIHSNKYLAIVDELTQNEDEATSSQKQVLSAADILGDIKASISSLTEEKVLLLSIKEENEIKINSLNLKIKALNEELNNLNQTLSNVDTIKSSLKNSFDEFNDKKLSYELNNKRLRDEYNESMTNKNVLSSRLNLLYDMQRENQGYAGSVKSLIRDSENNNTIKSAIIGVVANLIKVPKEYETAIEMALGNAVQNVVTKSEEDAKILINHLKKNQLGRATFLPLSSVKYREIDRALMTKLNKPGVCGIASNLISYDNNIDKAISSLLGGTVITKTLDDAISLSVECGYSFKVVTLDGDIINPAGSVTGGSKKCEINNILSRDREIKESEEKLVELNNIAENLKVKLEKDEKALVEINKSLEDITLRITKIDLDNAAAFEKRERFNSNIELFSEEKILLENKVSSSNEKLTEIDTKLASIISERDEVLVSKNVASENTQKRQSVFDRLKLEREHFNQMTTSLKIKIAALEAEVTPTEDENDRLIDQIEEIEFSISECEVEQEKTSQLIAGIFSLLEQDTNKTDTMDKFKILDNLKDEKLKIENSKIDLSESMKELEIRRSKIVTEYQVVQDKRLREEMALQKVDSDIEGLATRIYEEYELTYESCLPFKEEAFDLQLGQREVNRLKREINLLGSINVSAIEDYKLLSERYEEKLTQINDLMQAEENLTQTIKELSNEMITRFNESFVKINDNFIRVFRELFGGGNAHLELTESDDPLEAGIEIMAEPPGKKLGTISLLSGGERTLTAIAILFAILKLRPMPFCLLDEIEAALDDSNVDRFASYLKRFSENTQFIMITHKKPTMIYADNLYGVTMAEKGVTKMVSVSLSEAVKNAISSDNA